MKNIIFLLGITLATCFSSCKDDVIGNRVENPVETGDEILFGSSLVGTGADTRTVYGNRTDAGVPVYWKESGDDIAIFCLQSSQPASHLVNYTVKPVMVNGEPTEIAETVEKIKPEEAGLQWGSEEEHRFYAFYPATAVEGSDEENQTGKITANIPVTQQVQEWRIVDANDKGAIDGMKTYFGLPNMDYAYMYAFKKVNKSEVAKDGTIDLTFHNLVTVLDITVRGPETGSIIVTNINVSAIDGKNPILTGDFTCNIRAAVDGDAVSATCEPAGDLNEIRNVISIPCYDKDNNTYVTLGQNECLNVKAYLIPDDLENHQIQPRTLKITVSTLNGAAKVRTLETAAVTPHKINRVLLPKLVSGGINYWMSSLDPNIYATELSIPGSKMSVLTSSNKSQVEYQGATLEEQFDSGVRAFIFQTGARYIWTGGLSWSSELQIAISNDQILGEDYEQSVENYLKRLVTKIQEAQQEGKDNEFVVVTLTYAEGATDVPWGQSAGDFWMRTLRSKLKSYLDVEGLGKYIYNGGMTPSTTLGNLAGKILIKVNVNWKEMGAAVSDTDMPAMFALWSGAYPPGGVPLHWGSSSNLGGSSEMTWLYQEATRVRTDGTPGELDAYLTDKVNYIEEMFAASLTAYKKGDHNTWFMNDLGGWLDEESSTGTQNLAEKLTPDFFDKLQTREENAGLGLIYMNFADKITGSAKACKSPELIQTIIDNNFKFALRKAGSTTLPTTRTEYVTRMGSDGWDE